MTFLQRIGDCISKAKKKTQNILESVTHRFPSLLAKNKIFSLVGIMVILAGLPLLVFATKQQTHTQQQAAKKTCPGVCVSRTLCANFHYCKRGYDCQGNLGFCGYNNNDITSTSIPTPTFIQTAPIVLSNTDPVSLVTAIRQACPNGYVSGDYSCLTKIQGLPADVNQALGYGAPDDIQCGTFANALLVLKHRNQLKKAGATSEWWPYYQNNTGQFKAYDNTSSLRLQTDDIAIWDYKGGDGNHISYITQVYSDLDSNGGGIRDIQVAQANVILGVVELREYTIGADGKVINYPEDKLYLKGVLRDNYNLCETNGGSCFPTKTTCNTEGLAPLPQYNISCTDKGVCCGAKQTSTFPGINATVVSGLTPQGACVGVMERPATSEQYNAQDAASFNGHPNPNIASEKALIDTNSWPRWPILYPASGGGCVKTWCTNNNLYADFTWPTGYTDGTAENNYSLNLWMSPTRHGSLLLGKTHHTTLQFSSSDAGAVVDASITNGHLETGWPLTYLKLATCSKQ